MASNEVIVLTVWQKKDPKTLKSKQSYIYDDWGHLKKEDEVYPKLSLKHQDTSKYSDFIKIQHVINLVLLADDLNSSDYFMAVALNCVLTGCSNLHCCTNSMFKGNKIISNLDNC